MAAEGLRVEIATDLSLGLPGGCASAATTKNEKKRIFSYIEVDGQTSSINNQNKSQLVGWPPVCSYRKKKLVSETSKFYVKISMDGTPFMRKVDLKNQKGYADLFIVFEKLFSCFCSANTKFTPLYEDKDGDWMLVGDVPWEMFIESCKRLRILKHADSEEVQFKNGENQCVLHSFYK